MSIKELHSYFKLELDKTNNYSTPSFEHKEIDYWVNAAINSYISTRFTGNNSANDSFEQTQKRIDDLSSLIKTWSVDFPINKIEKIYTFNKWPTDYRFAVGESVYLFAMAENTPCFKGVPDGKVIKSEVPQSTISKKIHNYKQELVNSLSDHNLHNGEAQPISVWYGRDSSYVKLYTDGNYGIYRYVLDYIRQPYLVDWNVAAISYWRMAQSRLEMYNYKEMKDGYKVYVYSEMKVYTYNETSDSWGDGKSTSPSEELIMDQFPEYVWHEIIKLSVKLALENISDMQRAQAATADFASIE